MAFNNNNKSSSGSRIRLVSNQEAQKPQKQQQKRPVNEPQEQPLNVEAVPVVEDETKIEKTVEKKAKKTGNIDVSQLRVDKKKSGSGNVTIYGVLALILLAVYLISFFGMMSIDSDFNIAYFLRRINRNVTDFFVYATGGPANNMVNWRFYKSLIIVLAGMGLAVAGAVYKAIYRNTLASPDVMGVQSGGNLGGILYIALVADTETSYVVDYASTNHSFVEGNLQAIMTFVACFLSVILLSLVASTAGKGKMSSSAIVLTGVIFSAIIGSFVTLYQYHIISTDPDDPRLEVIKKMMLGTFDYASTLTHLVAMTAVMLPCFLVIFIFMGRMNVYSMGEDEATTMGMNIKVYKYIMIIPATMLVAVVMGYCGHIAYVAFLVPQIARKIAGTDFKRVLICSMLIGGILMTVVYDIANIFSMTDALNVLTTSIGGVVMIFILLGRRESRDAVIAE